VRSSAHFHRVERLFSDVVALPPDVRTCEVHRLCRGDAALCRDVCALLAADAEAVTFLESPLYAAAVTPDLMGRLIGPYRIVRPLGQGGMSTVYLAVRTDGVCDQQVAVKTLGVMPLRADLVARFRAERQILASLSHPGVARLLDGGTTGDGLPYLVMEYVDGLPIDRYCDERGLGVRDRLHLILDVCRAVAYAHQHLVVHRDLKPSNILVTADGQTRLVDFGIAKLLPASGAPAESTSETLTGSRLMTPAFASPEQIDGRAITPASDVYALGVLLYRLLTGRLPYRVDVDHIRALEDAILHREPPRPSVAAASTGARTRAAQLSGDLDNIVLMALRKDPHQRYASADALAQDIARYLAGRPVTARRLPARTRVRTVIRRHPRGAAWGSLAACLLIALAIIVALQAYRIGEQRDDILEQRTRTMRIARELQGLLDEVPARARWDTNVAARYADRLDLTIDPTAAAHACGRPAPSRDAAVADALDTVNRIRRAKGDGDDARTAFEAAMVVLDPHAALIPFSLR